MCPGKGRHRWGVGHARDGNRLGGGGAPGIVQGGDVLTIDGSEGEGGGQVLRSALTLAALTGTPFRLVNVRARRPRPGLAAQHLAALRAAAAVCDAEVEGAALGSLEVRFAPRAPRAGDY
ncbi:MAG TPA: hypothetical protein ENJ83_01040, partial [Rhodospirillales bacterium]|nr:hypothetical protein [Rhodospirillales bacterium]